MRRFLFFIISLISLAGNQAWANTYSCDGSQSNCQSVITNNAVAGDTVTLPAGTFTYTSPVSVTKGITVQGQGQGSTIVNASGSVAFGFHFTSGVGRLTGIGFTGSPGTNSGNILTPAVVVISGSQGVGIFDSMRVDHCSFTNVGSFSVVIGEWWDITSDPVVLLDHITYTNSGGSSFAKFFGINNAWKEPDSPGGVNNIFVEDSTFTWANGYVGTAWDTEHGVRLVARHNTITNGNFQAHDTGSTPASRGHRWYEYYYNTILCDGTVNSACQNNAGIVFRGGTGLAWNNTVSAYFYGFSATEIYRADYSNSWLGGACGSSSGNMCDNSTLMHCSNTYAPCAVNSDCSGGTCVVPCSSNSECGGYSCVSIDGPGGIPCRDQTGWGQENSSGINQISPIYWWGNKDQNGNSAYFGGATSRIRQGYEYCQHDPSTSCGTVAGWTYTPYIYPHPCQSGSCGGQAPPAIHPADINANARTVALYQYLNNLKNNSTGKILSGQHDEEDSLAAMNNIYSVTGKYPAIYGSQLYYKWAPLENYPQVVSEYISWAQSGGLIVDTMMMNNPDGIDPYTEHPYYVNPVNAITAGTSENNYLKGWLDNFAADFAILQSNNVPVLWRPFPEMNYTGSDGVFWWMGLSGSDYINLWKYVFNYMTQTKGLHNLLFVWSVMTQGGGSSSSLSVSTWYPGDAYVDIVGYDQYGDGTNMATYAKPMYDIIQALTSKPIAMIEYGYCSSSESCVSHDLSPLIASIKTYTPNIIWWMNWAFQYSMGCNANGSTVCNTGISALLSDSWVVNRPVSYYTAPTLPAPTGLRLIQ